MNLWWQEFNSMGWTQPLALFMALVETAIHACHTVPSILNWAAFGFQVYVSEQTKHPLAAHVLFDSFGHFSVWLYVLRTTYFFPLTVQRDCVQKVPCCNSTMRTSIICLWGDATQCSIFQVSSLSSYAGIHWKVNALHEEHAHHPKIQIIF